MSIHNISTYFTICDFAELGYTDFSVIKDVELSSLNTNDFFPYFILTDKKIMLFDAEFNNAIVSFDDKIINVHTRKFMALYEKGEIPSLHFQMQLILCELSHQCTTARLSFHLLLIFALPLALIMIFSTKTPHQICLIKNC